MQKKGARLLLLRRSWLWALSHVKVSNRERWPPLCSILFIVFRQISSLLSYKVEHLKCFIASLYDKCGYMILNARLWILSTLSDKYWGKLVYRTGQQHSSMDLIRYIYIWVWVLGVRRHGSANDTYYMQTFRCLSNHVVNVGSPL